MPAVGIEVTTVSTVDDELVEAFSRLVPQLSSSSPPPTVDQLTELVRSPASSVLIARRDGVIVGTLTLVVFRIPTAMRAIIEDVVVDDSARGQGVGELLTRRALQVAADRGCRTVDLTSRPSREAANRLYRRLGFELRDTNVYRYQS